MEKALLLHEEMHRPDNKTRPPRLSRHLYDLHCLIGAGVADQAIAHEGLFESVVTHRTIFFKQNWIDYDSLGLANLQLTPSDEALPEWRSDYEKMRLVMFYDDAPKMDHILRTIREFQAKLEELDHPDVADPDPR